MIADGGDALTHLAVLRDQGKLFGAVASEPTAWRAVERVNEPHLGRLREVRAVARERAWAAGAGPDMAAGVTIDLDATISVAHSDKENAAATWKKTYGFHRCWLTWTGRMCRAGRPRPCALPATWPAASQQPSATASFPWPPAWSAPAGHGGCGSTRTGPGPATWPPHSPGSAPRPGQPDQTSPDPATPGPGTRRRRDSRPVAMPQPAANRQEDTTNISDAQISGGAKDRG
jgi:hypothetical protein